MRPHDRKWHQGFACDVPVLGERQARVVFGVGSLDGVAREAGALGDRVVLIAGRHEQATAHVIAQQLRDQPGVEYAGRVLGVTQHVPVEVARDAVARSRELNADVVVALGGGSATGLAKAVALETGLPILAVPTTYAGSEMTPIWGLSDDAGKSTGRDARVLPRTVVYDPALTLALPAELTAASGMNALAHALEALYAPDTTPALSSVAEEAMAALSTALPLLVAHPEDLDARSQALYGAWLAGWALGSTTMGLHHRLAHVLGGTYRLPHAGVHSALLSQVADFNAPAAGRAFERAARALGVGDPADVGAALFDLAAQVGAPTALAPLGMEARAIEQVAATVAAGSAINPRPVAEADLIRVLAGAYRGARPLGRASPPAPPWRATRQP